MSPAGMLQSAMAMLHACALSPANFSHHVHVRLVKQGRPEYKRDLLQATVAAQRSDCLEGLQQQSQGQACRHRSGATSLESQQTAHSLCCLESTGSLLDTECKLSKN